MFTPPDDLPDETVASVVAEGWGIAVATLRYLAVGFGSHHWEVVDAHGATWFATVDELQSFERLHAALSTAGDLRDAGCTFVVAPVPSITGAPLVRISPQYAVALYPHVEGESYAFGEYKSEEHRQGVLDLLVTLHSVPPAVAPLVLRDDFTIPFRAGLERSLASDRNGWGNGPYAQPTASLVAENAERIRDSFEAYDNLTRVVRETGWPERAVLTHGEPHAGNTMLTSDGWVLVDWDTVLLALPERDLWSLDPGDGSIFEAYSRATGTALQPPALALYRLRWDLADIAVTVSLFGGDHTGNANDDASWEELGVLVARLGAAT